MSELNSYTRPLHVGGICSVHGDVGWDNCHYCDWQEVRYLRSKLAAQAVELAEALRVKRLLMDRENRAHSLFHEATKDSNWKIAFHGPDEIDPADFVRRLADAWKSSEASLAEARAKIVTAREEGKREAFREAGQAIKAGLILLPRMTPRENQLLSGIADAYLTYGLAPIPSDAVECANPETRGD